MAPSASATETGDGQLDPGEGLDAGQWMTSRDGHYTLVMQGDGNLVQYVGSRAIWSSRTWGNPGTVARMQGDGNFVLYAPGRGAIWSTRTYGHSGARLVVDNDSALRVFSQGGTGLWSTSTVDGQLDSGQKLKADWFLQSPDRRYRVIMQGDGNLALYDRHEHTAVWSTRTYGLPGSEIVMQGDGNLVIYAPGRGPVWSSHTVGQQGAVLRVENRGRLAMYAPSGAVVWSTRAAGEYVIEDRDDIEEVKSVAFQMASDRGWSSSGQHSCIEQLFHRESGWRWNADNPYSTAYGIPQALPGSKMASEGHDWETNPVTQIKWGYSYIAERYGTPCDAWAFWLANHWYRVAE